jgi:hypothetical protein
MEAVHFFKMSVNFYQSTWHHAPEDDSVPVISSLTNIPHRPIHFKTAHYIPCTRFSDLFKIIPS